MHAPVSPPRGRRAAKSRRADRSHCSARAAVSVPVELSFQLAWPSRTPLSKSCDLLSLLESDVLVEDGLLVDEHLPGVLEAELAVGQRCTAKPFDDGDGYADKGQDDRKLGHEEGRLCLRRRSDDAEQQIEVQRGAG